MSTAPSKTPWTRWLVTVLWGTAASAAIWLAGAHDVAYLGYIIAAIARESVPGRTCRLRLFRRATP